AGRSGKSHGEFSWGEALERNARIEKRSRRDAGAQKCRQGGQVELQRQSDGGESPWIDCVEPGVGATGTAELDAAMAMVQQVPGTGRVTVGGDNGFDTADFVRECRNMCVTPHVAKNLARRGGSAIDGRTTQHAAYRLSQKKRKRIEECFGWLKT